MDKPVVYSFSRKVPFAAHVQVSPLAGEPSAWPDPGTSAELQGLRGQHWKGPDARVLELGV